MKTAEKGGHFKSSRQLPTKTFSSLGKSLQKQLIINFVTHRSFQNIPSTKLQLNPHLPSLKKPPPNNERTNSSPTAPHKAVPNSPYTASCTYPVRRWPSRSIRLTILFCRSSIGCLPISAKGKRGMGKKYRLQARIQAS